MEVNDLSYEPMDVDLSSNSANDNINISGLSANVVVKEEKLDNLDTTEIKPIMTEEVKPQSNRGRIKKYHIKLEKKNDKNKSYLRVKILTAVIIICISVVFHFIINFKCSEIFQLEHLEETLSKNVYGQARAINTIMETLAMDDSSKILFLYGGTGVGKTFTTSLLLKEHWDSANVYHYTMPSFANTFSSDFMLGLTLCKTSTLVVDDLTRNDMHIKKQIKDVITKSEDLNKNITIILIFNCENVTEDFTKRCDESFYVELVESFKDIKAAKKFIRFDTLTEGVLRKCIEKELRDKKIHAWEMENILKNFNVALDGCKGVYKKIKSLNYI